MKVAAALSTALFMVALPATISSAATPTVRQGSTTTYGVLAAETITNTGATSISGTAGGDIGLSPGSSVTGLASITRSGADHITDTAASIAQTDLVTAFGDLSTPSPIALPTPDLAGLILTAGTYSNVGGTLANSGTLTLNGDGDPSSIFIFRAASTLITSTGSNMVLTNGAQACNVFWQVGSSATLGVSSTFVGHLYALTSIAANTGAAIRGQLLARTGAVTLDTNTIVNDRCASVSPTTTTTVPSDIPVLPSTGFNSLIWLFGAIVLIGLALGIIRIRR